MTWEAEMKSLEKHVSIFQGLAELGDATGVYAEAQRLQKELDKHNTYAAERIRATNPSNNLAFYTQS